MTVLAEGNIVGGLLVKGWEAVIPWKGGQTFRAHGTVSLVAIAIERHASTHLLTLNLIECFVREDVQ